MSVTKAKAYYTAKDGHKKLNCGQAVIAAFSKRFNIDENVVQLFVSFGSGRAPEGECGANKKRSCCCGSKNTDVSEKVGYTKVR